MCEELPEWMVYPKPLIIKAPTAAEARLYVERFYKLKVASTWRIHNDGSHK